MWGESGGLQRSVFAMLSHIASIAKPVFFSDSEIELSDAFQKDVVLTTGGYVQASVFGNTFRWCSEV